MDICGPVIDSELENKDKLVIGYHFTKFKNLYQMKDQAAETRQHSSCWVVLVLW